MLPGMASRIRPTRLAQATGMKTGTGVLHSADVHDTAMLSGVRPWGSALLLFAWSCNTLQAGLQILAGQPQPGMPAERAVCKPVALVLPEVVPAKRPAVEGVGLQSETSVASTSPGEAASPSQVGSRRW